MKFYRGSHEDRSDYREDELFLTIESLRSELLEVAQERSLSDHMVVELSQRLDGYIVMAQNKMMEGLRSRQKEPAPYGTISKSKRVRSKSALQQ
ncbi:aspartyl-phosphate phosphatase Spo0E family protein [Paenibacillus typhae]|uniref:aspartyl-phosphate phosphatase Spo0E family protein n=1 Tax=Paenibacillus typhae TaxID=1174501 RepID=UPI001C8D314A|nr:aspartyl-phosphate phosphatase Spo0E family protein [Paenibacillus typhae]MBY0009345.1 aspartyl-phosphate phosphatase Spo0E family protein [Paenibacillus typhae]